MGRTGLTLNSKWIKELNVRPDIIKLLEEKIDRHNTDINHSNISFDMSPRVMETKTKIIIIIFCHTAGM